MKQESKEWMYQSASELKSAKDLIKTKRYSQVAFHSHQAAEFAIKALLIEKKKLVVGHDLVYLARKLDVPRDILDKCDFLNPSYMDARYVDRAEIAPSKLYDKNRARKNLDCAKKIVKWTKDLLG